MIPKLIIHIRRSLICTFLLFLSHFLHAQCLKEFKYAIGGAGTDAAYSVADGGNGTFFVTGTSSGNGVGDDIVVTKMTTEGAVLWSKTYGGRSDETIRKSSKTSDGGIVLTGSTNSFGNTAGDILCMKIDKDGNAVWTRKFGLGSVYGDLGMDIIETGDGGYALTGIINKTGFFADMVVIKLDAAANIQWTKRFDRGDGEDGVGIVEIGNSLVVSSDLQNSGAEYELSLIHI